MIAFSPEMGDIVIAHVVRRGTVRPKIKAPTGATQFARDCVAPVGALNFNLLHPTAYAVGYYYAATDVAKRSLLARTAVKRKHEARESKAALR